VLRIRIQCFFYPPIRDVNLDPESEITGSYFRELIYIFLGYKYLNFCCGLGSGVRCPFDPRSGIRDGKIRIRDLGWKNSDPGSRMNTGSATLIRNRAVNISHAQCTLGKRLATRSSYSVSLALYCTVHVLTFIFYQSSDLQVHLCCPLILQGSLFIIFAADLYCTVHGFSYLRTRIYSSISEDRFQNSGDVFWKGGICSRIIILERSRAVSLLKGQCHNTFDLRFLK
jgi:hypothetical protein